MARNLTQALAESLELIEQQGLTLGECLARYPEHRAELAPLLSAALEARNAPAVRPTPAFRAAGRQLLLKQIRRQPPKFETRSKAFRSIWQIFDPSSIKRPAMRWITILATVVSLLAGGGTIGTVYASESALPNDTLYLVKIAVEQARLVISQSGVGDAQLHLDFAAKRLDEVAKLIEAGRGAEAEVALNNYSDQIEAATAIAQTARDVADQTAVADRVSKALYQHELTLAKLQANLPANAQTAVQGALDASARGRTAAEQALLNNTKDIAGQVSLRLRFAQDRLAAAAAFIGLGRPDLAAHALDGYSAEVEATSNLVASAPATDRSALAEMLSQALDTHETVLNQVGTHVPPEAQTAIQHALEVSATGRQVVESIMNGQTPSVVPTDIPAGKPTDLPGGQPTDIPGGKPTNTPGGRP